VRESSFDTLPLRQGFVALHHFRDADNDGHHGVFLGNRLIFARNS